MPEPIITVSGLRGVVGESLTPDVAARYARAFADTLPAGAVVVTRDGRANGPALLEAVVEGLAQSNSVREVLLGGVAATPTTGILVRQHGCVGGIQITASHNPAQYNGFKLFSAEGRVIPAAAGQEVLDAYHRTTSKKLGTSKIKQTTLDDTLSAHWELIQKTVDLDSIRKRKFRVVLDANHGSGSVLGSHVLEQLGCQVTVLGGEPDGLFAHPPEPTAENLAGVLKNVSDNRADIGFCQDPDADRLAIIDENGRYIGEEYTLAICADHIIRQQRGPLVTNCSTSRMTEDVAREYGVSFFRSAVGEANVVDKMLEVNAVLGGEGNGGVIDPRVGLVRDSFVGMALVLAAMATRELSASALADELPRYAICKTKIDLAPQKVTAGLDALARHFADAQANRLDGLRLDWPGRWLLVRASNTEPIVRANAEAETEAEAQRLCGEAVEVLNEVQNQ
jgi:phosphomannomutase